MKLDDYSKILLATSQINMLANNLNQVKSGRALFKALNNRPFLNDETATETETDTEIDKALNKAVDKLTAIYQKLADVLNDIDAVSPIDERISKVPGEILLFGMDETEEEYYEQTENE